MLIRPQSISEQYPSSNIRPGHSRPEETMANKNKISKHINISKSSPSVNLPD